MVFTYRDNDSAHFHTLTDNWIVADLTSSIILAD